MNLHPGFGWEREMFKAVLRYFLLITVILSVSGPVHSADIRAGQIQVKKLCASCHGVRGHGGGKHPEIPRLAGQQEKYLMSLQLRPSH